MRNSKRLKSSRRHSDIDAGKVLPKPEQDAYPENMRVISFRCKWPSCALLLQMILIKISGIIARCLVRSIHTIRHFPLQGTHQTEGLMQLPRS